MFVDFGKALQRKGIVASREAAEQMLEHDTTDGKQFVQQELTDDHARERRWVMVSDGSSACGPVVLIRVRNDKCDRRYITEDPNNNFKVEAWTFACPATPDETAKAVAEATKSTKAYRSSITWK